MADAQTESHPAEAVFNVRTYGAAGDGKAVDTPAINKAIEAVANVGGGTLIFPAGTYVCFTIRLKSNVELYLSRGCTILAADSPRRGETNGYNGGTYDAAEPNDPWTPYQDYGHNHWRNSLFYAENQHDFSICGPGLIFGKGLSQFSGETEADHAATLRAQEELRFEGAFTFAYSERAGTQAARKLPDDVPASVKQRRLAEVITIQQRVTAEILAAQIGRRERILIEHPSKRADYELMGRTDTFRPVIIPAAPGLGAGSLVDVTITGATPATLFGAP